MRNSAEKKHVLLLGVLCAVLTPLGFILYSGVILKTAAFLAGMGALWALLSGDVTPLRSPAAWPLSGYLVFAALSGLWALSGKLFFETYLQIFTAGAVFLILLLKRRFDAETGRIVLSVITATAALYAFLGVEAATTGLTKAVLSRLFGEQIRMTFTSIRLYGVFGNPNVEASVFAFGVFFSLALLVGARSRREHILCAVALSLCASALLMTFSMGALFYFALSIVIYLVFAGETRVAAFVRMLEGAVPALVCALISARFGGREGAAGLLPLAALLGAAALTVLSELRLAERAAARLAKRQKLLLPLFGAVVAAAAVYLAVGFSVNGAYTFGSTITRTFYPAAGEHTLLLDASGDVRVRILAQSEGEVVDATRNYIYDDTDDEVFFTVPEDSISCSLVLSARAGTTLRAVTLDDGESIPLGYPLLPESVVTRLQGLRTNVSVLQRREMIRDGLALWRMRPIAGNGVGSFELGQELVKRSSYQTKYVHSNYVQTLLETGVIGFILWLGALLAPLTALWLRRRDTAHPMRWAYGALWAAASMALLQPTSDVSLSFCVFLWYVFALFALILRLYAPGKKAASAGETPEAGSGKKARRAADEAARARRAADSTIRIAAAAAVGLFLLTIALCGAAERIASKPAETEQERLAALARAARLDVYNGDYYRYSYLYYAAFSEALTSEEASQADSFAQKLESSGTTSYVRLVSAYYYDRGWYPESVEAAKKLAAVRPVDEAAWRAMTELLASCYDRAESPLLGANGAELMDALLEYRAMLDDANEKAYTPILLDGKTEAFFDKVADARSHADDAAYLSELFSG